MHHISSLVFLGICLQCPWGQMRALYYWMPQEVCASTLQTGNPSREPDPLTVDYNALLLEIELPQDLHQTAEKRAGGVPSNLIFQARTH